MLQKKVNLFSVTENTLEFISQKYDHRLTTVSDIMLDMIFDEENK